MAGRLDGRLDDELRPVVITRGFTSNPAGSVLIEFGATRVMCTASVTEGVPRWRKGSGLGWLTAEYAMLPAATHTRSDREAVRGRVGGRTHEISRLVGRSLRACIDLAALGENTIAIDCDVLQADGGTRTAAISGAWVALRLAVNGLLASGAIKEDPITGRVAAVSCGIFKGTPVLDLDYIEDSDADADANFVLIEGGQIAEVQATAEGATYDEEGLLRLLRLARMGTDRIFAAQAEAVK